jgi:hypothetical protein
MTNEPVIESMDALKSWFFQNSMPKFTLYRGHDNTASKRILNFKAETAEKAWETLELTLKNYGYRGNYYVFVTDSKTDSGGGFSTPVELYGRNQRRINGINDVGAEYGGGLPAGYVTLEMMNQAIANARMEDKIGRLEEENDALRNGGGAQKAESALERVFNEALQDEGSGKEMISGVKNFMSSLGIAAINFSKVYAGGKGAAVNGLLDAPKPLRKATEQPKEPANTEGTPQYNDADLDWRKAGEITERMKGLFPNHSPQNVVNGLAKFLEDNPSMKEIVEAQVGDYINQEENIPSPNDDDE